MTKRDTPESALRFTGWLRQRTRQDELDTKGQRTLADVKIAAAHLLEQKGYNEFSMADIAAEAKVSRPALYQYVESKQALVLDLLEDFYRFMSETLRSARGTRNGSNLHQINRTYVGFFAANAKIIVSIEQVRDNLNGVAKMQFDLNERWAQKIARQLTGPDSENSDKPADDVLLTAYALEHMVDGLLTDIYVRKNPALARFSNDPDAIARVLSNLWLKALSQRETNL